MSSSENLRLSSNEAYAVLSSLGYVNKSRGSKEWRGPAKCHGGDGAMNFSYKYDIGVAKCHSAQCFASGVDIYGVVEHEKSINFFYAKRYVEEIIGRKLEDGFSPEKRSFDYYESLIRNIEQIGKAVDHEISKKRKILSDNESWKIYAKNSHPYWNSRGFSEETLKYFGAGYNPESDRVTVPIFDYKENGESSFVSLKQRVVSSDREGHVAKYLHDSYDAGSVLFNLQNAVQYLIDPNLKKRLLFPGLIVLEGNLDVMMAHQLGHPNVVGTGTNCLTSNQARLIERYCDTALFIPDEDQKKDGEKRVWRGGNLLESAKKELGKTLTIYYSRTNPIKDIGSMTDEDDNMLLSAIISNRKRF